VIAEHMRGGTGLFEDRLNRESELICDAYCGSLCASTVKKKIHLKLKSFFRLPEARRIVTELMKGCENIVRARHGIRARLSAPPVTGSSYIITARSAEEVAYMSYYDSPEEELTHEKAAEIEAQSWQNVESLTVEDVHETSDSFAEEPDGAFFSDGIDDVTDVVDAAEETTVVAIGDPGQKSTDEPKTLEASEPSVSTGTDDEKYKKVLWTAAEGGNFASACRELGLFADTAAAHINEIALEFIGDVVLEQSGTDYVFIEDYIDDIGILF